MKCLSPRRWPAAAVAGLFILWLPGCVARVGSDLSVPPDAAGLCAQQCASIGLGMTAVTIMANNVGCVCQPRGPQTAQAGSASAVAGMATIMLQENEQQRQQAAQQRTR